MCVLLFLQWMFCATKKSHERPTIYPRSTAHFELHQVKEVNSSHIRVRCFYIHLGATAMMSQKSVQKRFKKWNYLGLNSPYLTQLLQENSAQVQNSAWEIVLVLANEKPK